MTFFETLEAALDRGQRVEFYRCKLAPALIMRVSRGNYSYARQLNDSELAFARAREARASRELELISRHIGDNR